MNGYFKDKVALVTGSSRGIGREISRALCQAGACVVLNGRDGDRLARLRDEFASMGYRATCQSADVTDYQQCVDLVNSAVETFGRLDILVTNASASMDSTFDKMDLEAFRRVADSNFYGTVLPTKAALPFIIQARGHIIFISSVAGLFGMPGASAYSAGKMAITAFRQSLRSELRATGIHLGIVYPGFTVNDQEKKVLNAEGVAVPVPDRPKWLQQSQEQVARSVLRCIYRRKEVNVLSAHGNVVHTLARFAPRALALALRKAGRSE